MMRNQSTKNTPNRRETALPRIAITAEIVIPIDSVHPDWRPCPEVYLPYKLGNTLNRVHNTNAQHDAAVPKPEPLRFNVFNAHMCLAQGEDVVAGSEDRKSVV